MRLAFSYFLVLLLTVFLLPMEVFAKETIVGPVPARLIRVIDGDTIDVQAQVWLGQHIETRVRLLGLDTPEIHGKCVSEKELAQKAKTFVMEQIGNDPVILKNVHYGKYAGRILADVELKNGVDLAQLLIKQGLARIYLNGKRKGWCP